jgi:DNA-binding NarL/FixJ family response regulator
MTTRRMCWWAAAELALARHQPERALAIVDQLLATARHIDTAGPQTIPVLSRMRGEALAALRRPAEAEAALRAAEAGARQYGLAPLHWRIAVALGRLYQSQRRMPDADQAFETARAIITDLADNVPAPDLRAGFLQQATALLPRPRPLTALRAAKQRFGGLTAREREVARLIAQGQSNREIAATLFVGEATVATHVSNILGKLDLTSRAQIAAWAVEHDLSQAE